MLVDRERIGSTLPFGYYVERESDLLLLRRADGTLVAAFSVRGVDLFEVEFTVWEDADQDLTEKLGALAVIKGKEQSGTKSLTSYRNQPHD